MKRRCKSLESNNPSMEKKTNKNLEDKNAGKRKKKKTNKKLVCYKDNTRIGNKRNSKREDFVFN